MVNITASVLVSLGSKPQNYERDPKRIDFQCEQKVPLKRLNKFWAQVFLNDIPQNYDSVVLRSLIYNKLRTVFQYIPFAPQNYDFKR